MTTKQTPKTLLATEQYVALLRQIRKIHKELLKIDYAIRYGKQNINEMEEMIGDVME